MAYSTVPPPDVGAIASSTPVQIFGSQNRKSHLMNVTIVMRRALEKELSSASDSDFPPKGRGRGLPMQNFCGSQTFRRPP